MIEFIEFTDDKANNRKELAKDVVGVKCIFCGSFNPDSFVADELPTFTLFKQLTPTQRFGTLEYYANGRANVYVREKGIDPAIGFLRVTPDE